MIIYRLIKIKQMKKSKYKNNVSFILQKELPKDWFEHIWGFTYKYKWVYFTIKN